jgi:hypothetical protein
VLRIRDVCPRSGSASKNLSIFNPKNCYQALGKMIWDFHFGSRIRIFPPSRIRIPDPGVKKAPDPVSGSATLLGTYIGTVHNCVLTFFVIRNIFVQLLNMLQSMLDFIKRILCPQNKLFLNLRDFLAKITDYVLSASVRNLTLSL